MSVETFENQSQNELEIFYDYDLTIGILKVRLPESKLFPPASMPWPWYSVTYQNTNYLAN